MKDKATTLVIGLGEVGKPLLSILSAHHRAIGIDIALPSEPIEHVDVMHICYPYEIGDFVGETVRYVERIKPSLTIINSTVGVGTTRKIAGLASAAVVHSPVRGKHAHMQDDMLRYTKFVGPLTPAAGHAAAEHFAACGLKTKVLSSPEATELGKLSETTYFGVLISFAQELERYCDRVGADYDEVISLFEGINFLPPVKYFPGVIGGHCVMPNIAILSKVDASPLLQAIKATNLEKIRREAKKQSSEETNKAGIAARSEMV